MARDTITLVALAFAGLGEIAMAELRDVGARALKSRRLRNYDQIDFLLPRKAVDMLRTMRTCEDLLVVVANRPQLKTNRDLDQLRKSVSKENVLAGLAVKNRFMQRTSPARKTTSFACFVKQSKDRSIRRSAVAQHIEQAIQRGFPRWRAHDPADLELWALWQADVTVGLRLTDERFRYRDAAPPSRAGALRPTIAAAMVRTARLQPGESVLDPLCGSGTVLAEAAAGAPECRLFGSDVDSQAVKMTRSRNLDAQVEVRDVTEIHEADARTHDCIISNLPWGTQYGVSAKSYTRIVSAFDAMLRPGGRVVVLTDRNTMLEQALRERGFSFDKTARVLVRGKWATIYAARK